LFTKAILEDKPIQVFNHGKMLRDFTYIDDIVEGVVRVISAVPAANPAWSGDAPDPGTSYKPYRIFNIGNNNPVELTQFIAAIEKALGKKAEKELMDIQPGDVAATYANIDDLYNAVGFKPETGIDTGIENFIEWYRSYYKK
jgi:UDP-glucuronate 4-epimerase